jgi:hypothetical protein
VDALLRAGAVGGAYELGDGPVLVRQLRLAAADVELIRAGAAILAHWRTASRDGSALGVAA